MSDFKDWLQSVGLEKYGEVFASHDIDLTVVPDLTEQDLEKLGLSLGHRRKFIAAAAKFRAAPTSSPVALGASHNQSIRPRQWSSDASSPSFLSIWWVRPRSAGSWIQRTLFSCCANTGTPAWQ